MKNVFAIVGSASANSSNLQLVNYIASLTKAVFHLRVYDALQQLPHFNPAQSIENTPQSILNLRNEIDSADGVLICTPEYIFSIPSGLKNIFEWCVSTTVFANKPVGLITASAHGVKGHEELKLILKTVDAFFVDETTLLIKGIKGKMDSEGKPGDEKTGAELQAFVAAFHKLITATDS